MTPKTWHAPALGVLLALGVTASAVATTISGSFQVNGAFIPTLDGSPLTTFLGADEIDVTDGLGPTPGTAGTITVTSTSGDFSSLLTVGQTGTMQDFAFGGPPNPLFPAPPITNFQHIGNISVNLTSITVIQQNESFLRLGGSTSVSAPQFDATTKPFTFVGQASGGGAFQFGATVEAVPEPSPLSLLFAAVAAFGFARARRSRQR